MRRTSAAQRSKPTQRSKNTQRRKSASLRSGRRPSFESLEDRLALALNVPSVINPALAQQVLFGPDVTHHELPDAAAETMLRFAFDSIADGPVKIRLVPDGEHSIDGALAIYDADGNRIQAADNNSTPSQPGSEELTVTLESRQEYIL